MKNKRRNFNGIQYRTYRQFLIQKRSNLIKSNHSFNNGQAKKNFTIRKVGISYIKIQE